MVARKKPKSVPKAKAAAKTKSKANTKSKAKTKSSAGTVRRKAKSPTEADVRAHRILRGVSL